LKKILIILFILILAGAVVGFIVWKYPISIGSRSERKTTLRRIQYGFTIQNSSNQLVTDSSLWVFAPVQKNSYQLCRNIDASHSFEIEKNEDGDHFLHFVIDQVPPYGSRVINITADVELFHHLEKTDDSSGKEFLEPWKNIESNDPEIVMRAKALKTEDPIQTTKKIFEWVSLNVQYERHSGLSRGAVYALKNLKGDCTEYADLFTALCRAAGFPARSIGGYVCPRDMVLKALDYHNWSEVFLDGAWRIADPQRKVFLTGDSEYVATRIFHSSKNLSVPVFEKFYISDSLLNVKMNF
jgi:hypothetical protein